MRIYCGQRVVLASKPLIVLAVCLAVPFGFITVQDLHLSGSALEVSRANGCEKPPGYVLMILDERGFNDSIGRGEPALQVGHGETVNILVCNLDPVQSHGLAIDHYFPTGVVLRPGEAYKISFVANDTGSFTLYCNVFCTVHSFMRGRLIVN